MNLQPIFDLHFEINKETALAFCQVICRAIYWYLLHFLISVTHADDLEIPRRPCWQGS
jgi:hypothetical protein